jgi:flagellar protein FlaF
VTSVGFSVSGSAAIVFASLFIAFGMWYTASANSFERVTEAQQDRTDGVLETRNTGVAVSAADYNQSGDGTLVVAVDNTGTAQLSVSETDLLVDGSYTHNWNSSVAGNPDTDLWLAGEQLTITVRVGNGTAPDRIKVVTETGVADSLEVTDRT